MKDMPRCLCATLMLCRALILLPPPLLRCFRYDCRRRQLFAAAPCRCRYAADACRCCFFFIFMLLITEITELATLIRLRCFALRHALDTLLPRGEATLRCYILPLFRLRDTLTPPFFDAAMPFRHDAMLYYVAALEATSYTREPCAICQQDAALLCHDAAAALGTASARHIHAAASRRYELRFTLPFARRLCCYCCRLRYAARCAR